MPGRCPPGGGQDHKQGVTTAQPVENDSPIPHIQLFNGPALPDGVLRTTLEQMNGTTLDQSHAFPCLPDRLLTLCPTWAMSLVIVATALGCLKAR